MEGKAKFQLEDSEKRGNPSSYPSMGRPCVAPHSSRVQDFGGFLGIWSTRMRLEVVLEQVSYKYFCL